MSDTAVTADAQPAGLDPMLRRALEQTLIPSPNVVELAPSKASAFTNRLVPADDDVAELFHLNTRMSRHQPDVRLSETEKAGVRDWYFTSCGKYGEEDLAESADTVRRPHSSLPAGLAGVLAEFGAGGSLLSLLFGCDVMVVWDGMICRQTPGEDSVWVEHLLPDGAAERIAATGADAWSREALAEAEFVLVLTGVPWRSMLGGGARGYRRMLMDAGVLLDVVCGLAQHHGLDPRPVFDFYDDELDGLLYCDGLERSALALVPVLRPEKSEQDEASEAVPAGEQTPEPAAGGDS